MLNLMSVFVAFAFASDAIMPEPQPWLKTWIIGIAAVAAMGYILNMARTKALPMLLAWELNRFRAFLGAKTGDPVWDWYKGEQVRIHVILMQKLYPAAGMGAERRRKLIELLTSKVPAFRGKEKELGDLIDAVVAGHKGLLDQISRDVAAPPEQIPGA